MPKQLHIHYRSKFQLQPATEQADWTQLIKGIRHWLSRNRNVPTSIKKEGIFHRWFFTGGRINERGILIITDQESGKGDESRPEYWALRFEHPDDHYGYRRWRTDIGVHAREDGRFHMAVTVSHYLRDDFIGEPPEVPSPRRPWLIPFLLGHDNWQGYAGSLPIADIPVDVTKESFRYFWEHLRNPARTAPVVLLMPDKETGDILLDAGQLANALAGSAAIYVGSETAYLGLNRLAPEDYRCYSGYARIYQPGLNPANPLDYRRHRYFTRRIIQENPETVASIIIDSLARRTPRHFLEAFKSIDDLIPIRRTLQLEKLRKEGASTEELVQLLDENNQELEARIRTLEEDIEFLEEETSELKDDLAEKQSFSDHLQRELDRIKEENRELRQRTDALASFATLPKTLAEVVERIAAMHADRIVFTERAQRAAEDYKEFRDIDRAWELLWSIPTILFPLYFKPANQGKDIEREYEAQTTFDFSRTEGRATKRDRKAMTERLDKYNGQEIDITPHVGFGRSEPDLLRVHFFVDREAKKIVIGHCGGHLTTAGTRRQR